MASETRQPPGPLRFWRSLGAGGFLDQRSPRSHTRASSG